jgi:hypothetical protein
MAIASHESVLAECYLSVVCLRLQSWIVAQLTAIGTVMMSSQADRASTWVHQTPNSIEIGLAVFEQWRSWWAYPPFSTANIGSSFKTVRVRPMITMKHYREVDVGLPESTNNLTFCDLQGSSQGHESENRA